MNEQYQIFNHTFLHNVSKIQLVIDFRVADTKSNKKRLWFLVSWLTASTMLSIELALIHAQPHVGKNGDYKYWLGDPLLCYEQLLEMSLATYAY